MSSATASSVDANAVLGTSQTGIPVHALAQAKVLPVVTLRNPDCLLYTSDAADE